MMRHRTNRVAAAAFAFLTVGTMAAVRGPLAPARAVAEQSSPPAPQSSPQLDALLRQLNAPQSWQRAAALDALIELGEPAVEPLIARLQHRNWSVRESAARALGRLGSKRAVEPLVNGSDDVSWQVRRAVAQALGRLADARATEALIARLEDDDWTVRRAAAEALGRTADPAALDALLSSLRDARVEVRRATVGALDDLADERAVEPLLACLDAQDWSLREEAAGALATVGKPAVTPLIERFQGADLAQRRLASRALAEMGPPAVGPLIECLEGPAELRREAADVLANIGTPATGPLTACLDHADGNVRGAAAGVLEQLGWSPATPHQQAAVLVAREKWDDVAGMGATALEALLARKNDNDAFVRAKVAETLGKLGEAVAAEPLAALLDDEDPQVRWHAANGLGRVGGKAAVRPLIACLKDPDADVRRVAAKALGETKDSRAVKPLVACLNDAEGSVARAAAEALGAAGDPAAVPPLIEALDRPDLGAVAATALGRLGDRRALAPLLDCMEKPDLQLRVAAIEALGDLGGRQAQEAVHARLQAPNESDPIRRSCVIALGKLGDPRATEPLIAYVIEADSAFRRRAIEALRRLGDAPIDQLAERLESPDPAVRKKVGAALLELGYQPPTLETRVALAVARRAWGELEAMGDSALGPLATRLRHPDARLRTECARLLEKLEYRPAAPAAIVDLAMVQEDEAAIRELDLLAVEPLTTWLEASDAATRRRAANLLAALRYAPRTQMGKARLLVAQQDWPAVEQLGAAAAEPLALCLDDADAHVARRAAELLGQLGDRRAAPYLAAHLFPAWEKRRDAHALLTKLDWQPGTDTERVYWHIAAGDFAWLKQNWATTKRVLFADLHSRVPRKVKHAAYALIATGHEDAVSNLIVALNRDGTVPMAETFYNCGEPRLRRGAEAWATERGYVFKRGPGGAREAFWGRRATAPRIRTLAEIGRECQEGREEVIDVLRQAAAASKKPLEEHSNVDGPPNAKPHTLTPQLRDWYERLPDDNCKEHNGMERGKLDGVYLAIDGVASGGGLFSMDAGSGINVNIDGRRIGVRGPVRVKRYTTLGIVLKRGQLTVYMLPRGETLSGQSFNGLFEILNRGHSYGAVKRKDYVFIDSYSRHIYVNGELRTPRQ